MNIPRRRLQFGMSSLLVALTVVGVILGWQVGRVRRKQQAIATVQELGGTVVYDYQWSSSKAWIPDAKPPGIAWMRDLLGDTYAAEAVEVQLFKDKGMSPERFGDVEAGQIGVLEELEWLVLQDTRLTDSGLQRLKGLCKLRRLDLEGSLVTEEGIAELQRALPCTRVFY